jgi:hypothetical protein
MGSIFVRALIPSHSSSPQLPCPFKN